MERGGWALGLSTWARLVEVAGRASMVHTHGRCCRTSACGKRDPATAALAALGNYRARLASRRSRDAFIHLTSGKPSPHFHRNMQDNVLIELGLP